MLDLPRLGRIGILWSDEGISSGTRSVVGTELTAPIIDDSALAYSLANEGGVCDTFFFCLNVMGLWIVQECRRTLAGQGEELSYVET